MTHLIILFFVTFLVFREDEELILETRPGEKSVQAGPGPSRRNAQPPTGRHRNREEGLPQSAPAAGSTGMDGRELNLQQNGIVTGYESGGRVIAPTRKRQWSPSLQAARRGATQEEARLRSTSSTGPGFSKPGACALGQGGQGQGSAWPTWHAGRRTPEEDDYLPTHLLPAMAAEGRSWPGGGSKFYPQLQFFFVLDDADADDADLASENRPTSGSS